MTDAERAVYDATLEGNWLAFAREVEATKRETVAAFGFLGRPVYALLTTLVRLMERR